MNDHHNGDDFVFRYNAVGGLEYSERTSTIWKPITGEMLMRMNARSLRRIAEAMEASDDE